MNVQNVNSKYAFVFSFCCPASLGFSAPVGEVLPHELHHHGGELLGPDLAVPVLVPPPHHLVQLATLGTVQG